MGTDGRADTGELRPPNGYTWFELFNNVRELIRKRMPEILPPEKYKIYAGSGKQTPCGGHIHIGGIGHNPRPVLLVNLDTWISQPLNTISDSRVRADYARMGQYRSQPHGWEYRSPPSWISTPNICAGALCIAKVLLKAHREITDVDSLLKLACKRERRVIVAFYEEIDKYKKLSKKLEDLEVYVCWGVKVAPKKQVTVAFNTDPNMARIFAFGELKCYIPMRFIGVSAERTADMSIYVPTNFPSDYLAELVKDFSKVRFERWTNTNFGLSYMLRQDVEYAYNSVQKMVRIINNIERERMKTVTSR